MKHLWHANGLLNWWRLRSVGNLKVLKVSYFVLFAAPVLSKYESIATYLGLSIWLIVIAFFASLCLALANLIYDIACPTVIKRFDSPNDLYKEMLEIKNLSAHLYPDDGFDASLKHCKASYMNLSTAKPFWGLVCALFYNVAGLLFLMILANRVFIVFIEFLF